MESGDRPDCIYYNFFDYLFFNKSLVD